MPQTLAQVAQDVIAETWHRPSQITRFHVVSEYKFLTKVNIDAMYQIVHMLANAS